MIRGHCLDCGEPIDPLVARDCDLTDFKFMPLEIERLRRSRAWLMAKRQPELGFYMLNLWMASWHEVPAASLEDDDDVLADAAMCDPRKWPKVREQAMRGWVRCSDGRLYHRIVAEKANESWEKKQARRVQTEAARTARLQKGNGRATAYVTNSVTENATSSVTANVASNVTASKREGEREVRENPPRSPPTVTFSEFWQIYPNKVGKDDARKVYERALKRASAEQILAGVRRYIETKPIDRPWCNPSTFLNQGRWTDEPAGTSNGTEAPAQPDAIARFPGWDNYSSKERAQVRRYAEHGLWAERDGPLPGEPGCMLPPELAQWAIECRSQR